jgi:hypothetical protein
VQGSIRDALLEKALRVHIFTIVAKQGLQHECIIEAIRSQRGQDCQAKF